MNGEKFRRERQHFPALKELIYFDNASFGLVPDYVLKETEDNIRDRCFHQNIGLGGKPQYEMLEEIRPIYAKVLNADASDIAFGLSSSQMYCILSGNLEVSAGDNVVMPDNAFITTPFAFDAREADGLEVRMAKTANGFISAEDLCSYADEHTRVIAVNHVESSCGYRIDMEYVGRFCRERGIIFAVDAAQSCGVLPIDVKRMNIDFLVGTDYKWLCHFRGVGFAYVSKALREKLPCRSAGWGSDVDRFNTTKRHWDPHPDARRYELGGFNNIGLYCVSKVMEHYLALRRDDVEEYVLDLADYCYEKAEASEVIDIAYKYPRENRSQIVVIKIPASFSLSTEMLREYGVYAAVNGGPKPSHGGVPSDFYTIRLGLHYFLNREDLDKLFAAIEDCCKNGGMRNG